MKIKNYSVIKTKKMGNLKNKLKKYGLNNLFD